METKAKEILRWSISEKLEPRSKEHNIITGIITGTLAGISLLFLNFTYAVLLVLFGVVYIILPYKRSKEHTFKLDEFCFWAGEKGYLYDDIECFNIYDDKGDQAHLMVVVGGLEGEISIPIYDKDIDAVEDVFISNKVKRNPKLIPTIIDYLAKFI